MTNQNPTPAVEIEAVIDEAPKEALPEGFMAPKEFALAVATAAGIKFEGKNLRRLLRSGEVEGAKKFGGSRWGIPATEVAKVVSYLKGKAEAKAAAAAAKEAGDEPDEPETLS